MSSKIKTNTLKLIGEEIRGYRINCSNISQTELSKSLGVSRSLLNKIENGLRKIDEKNIKTFCNVLNLELYDYYKLMILSGFDVSFEKTDIEKENIIKILRFLKIKGFINEREKIILSALQIFDKSVELFSLLADLHLQKRDYVNAESYLLMAIDLYKEIGSDYISLSSLYHNYGNIYFEKALTLNEERNFLILKISVPNNKSKESDLKIEMLGKIIINNLKKAEDFFLKAHKIERSNPYIIEQLAKLYFNLGANYKKKYSYYKKSEFFYHRLLEIENDIGTQNKMEAGVFIALIKAKTGKIDESLQLINLLLNFNKDFALSYYCKALIYLIKQDNLEKAFYYLEKSFTKNSYLRELAKYDIDLNKLRFNEQYKNKFEEIVF